jgi:hypothetical protein
VLHLLWVRCAAVWCALHDVLLKQMQLEEALEEPNLMAMVKSLGYEGQVEKVSDRYECCIGQQAYFCACGGSRCLRCIALVRMRVRQTPCSTCCACLRCHRLIAMEVVDTAYTQYVRAFASSYVADQARTVS